MFTTLDDSSNPDYLGDFIFSADKTNWNYNGDLLSPTEQQQVVGLLKIFNTCL